MASIKPVLTPVFLLGIFLIAASGCVNDPVPEMTSGLNGEIIRDDQLRSTIASAPAEISIDGITYRAEAYIWRDFAPGIGLSLGLMSQNTLVRIDQNEIPAYLELKQQYVINGDSIWVPGYDDDDRPNAIPYQKTKVSRHGPEWDVGSKVSIGINILNEITNKEYIILVSDKTINATS